VARASAEGGEIERFHEIAEPVVFHSRSARRPQESVNRRESNIAGAAAEVNKVEPPAEGIKVRLQPFQGVNSPLEQPGG